MSVNIGHAALYIAQYVAFLAFVALVSFGLYNLLPHLGF
jgi:hypothetical protein